jgi:hypothetical protein
MLLQGHLDHALNEFDSNKQSYMNFQCGNTFFIAIFVATDDDEREPTTMSANMLNLVTAP